MYATQVSFDTSVHICERVCTCTLVCSVCSLALEDEGGKGQLVYVVHLLLAWVVFDMKKMGCCLYFLYFFGGLKCMWPYNNVGHSGCMCVYKHTQTHTERGVLGC